MDLNFLKRIGRTTALVGVVVFSFVAVYYDTNFALGLLIGCGWGVANFAALTALLTTVVAPGKVSRRRAVLLAAIKFPVLYLAGYGILRFQWFAPEALLTGFSLLFLVTLMKALGRTYLHLDHRAALVTPKSTGAPARRTLVVTPS